jgi:hypothetical protein
MYTYLFAFRCKLADTIGTEFRQIEEPEYAMSISGSAWSVTMGKRLRPISDRGRNAFAALHQRARAQTEEARNCPQSRGAGLAIGPDRRKSTMAISYRAFTIMMHIQAASAAAASGVAHRQCRPREPHSAVVMTAIESCRRCSSMSVVVAADHHRHVAALHHRVVHGVVADRGRAQYHRLDSRDDDHRHLGRNGGLLRVGVYGARGAHACA